MTATFIETRAVPTDQLVKFPGNAQRGDIPAIRESLRASAQYRALVVRRLDDGALVVLAGNNTLEAMRQEGWGHARCEILECDDATAIRINVADNRTGALGETDSAALAELLIALKRTDAGLTGTGFAEPDVEALLAAAAVPVPVEAFTAPSWPPAATPVAVGQPGGLDDDEDREVIYNTPPATDAAYAETPEQEAARDARIAGYQPRVPAGFADLILTFTLADKEEVARHVESLRRLLGDVRTSDIVLRVLRATAALLDTDDATAGRLLEALADTDPARPVAA